MTINAEMRQSMEGKLIEEINQLNFAIREIIECSTYGIVAPETALSMRDHIDDKTDKLDDMYSALKKAERICYASPVTGPMARNTRGPVEELTDADKALIMEAYKKYYPNNFPV